MKYIIFLLSVIYITAISSCKSGALTDDHQHDETENLAADHVHTEGEEPGTDVHTEGEDHVHTEAEAEEDHLGEAEAIGEEDDHMHEGENHTIMKVEKGNFRFTHKTSGQILVDKKDEILITATGPGIIRFFDHLLFPGVALSAGQQLFGIYGEKLTEGNPNANFNNALLEYEAAEANYNRASQLIEDKLITAEHFLDVKLEFEKARLKYKLFSQSLNADGSVVNAPFKCYIQEIFVKEGQKVETGQILASVIIEHNIILKADVAPTDLGILKQIKGARFSTGYNPKVYSTSEMNGTLISFGKSTNDNSYYIPVYFRIDYDSELIPGTFAEVWLLGNLIEDVIVIPNTAIMEEYGKFYLFVENPDGSFEKRYIRVGETDGEMTHIIEGLHESEMVVVEGAYQIKMSQMTSIPSAHTH